MAQAPQNGPQRQQLSAMFEALATTSLEHDEICSLLPSQQHLPASSPLTEHSGSAGVTKELPYSDRGTEAGDEEDASVPVVKSWWSVATNRAGWDRRPKVYRAVRQ